MDVRLLDKLVDALMWQQHIIITIHALIFIFFL